MARCKDSECKRRVGDVSPKSTRDRVAQAHGYCSDEHAPDGYDLPETPLDASERKQAGWE